MTELIRVPSKGFYKLLDKIANNEKTTRDYFDEALTLARREKFTDLEIALLMKDYLKDKIPKTTLHRWTKALEPTEVETDTEIDESTSQSVPMEQIDDNSDTEETPTEPELEDEPEEVEIKEQTDDARVSYWTGQQKENISKIRGLETEIDYINSEMAKLREALTNANIDLLSKDKKVVELEDALKKTEMFKPASKLTEEQARDMTMEVVKQAGLAVPQTNIESVCEWLKKRDDGVNCYWYDGYGIELFKTRVLTQLKGKGVTTFKRLYFEV